MSYLGKDRVPPLDIVLFVKSNFTSFDSRSTTIPDHSTEIHYSLISVCFDVVVICGDIKD